MSHSQEMAKQIVYTADQIAHFMQVAQDEAKKAYDLGEVPIGAVIVHQGQIIGQGHNLTQTSQATVAHAEIMAIEAANKALNSWRLDQATLFVTVEPCVMCAGAILNARIPVVYYGAKNQKFGGVHSQYQLLSNDHLNHQSKVVPGIMANSSQALMKEFFKSKRLKKQQ